MLRLFLSFLILLTVAVQVSQDGSWPIYLPFLTRGGQAQPATTPSPVATAARTGTPTATVSPTVTPTPPVTIEPPADPNMPVIVNGDFEQGAGKGWYEQSPTGMPVIVQTGPPGMKSSRAGGWFVWLGGAHNLGETENYQSRIIQSEFVTPPVDQSIYLHLNYQIISEEQPNQYDVCDRDVLNFWIRRPSGSFLFYQGQICEQFNTNGWTHAVFDLSSFAGQQIALEFQMRTNYDLVSHVLLDDLQFRSTQ